MKARTLTVHEVEEAIGSDMASWSHDCHAVSIAIVMSDLFPVSRVARGTCRGVGAQHSWVVIGNDCYDERAEILDATLWSYDSSVEGLWHGTAAAGRHRPHGGEGTIWTWGRPPRPVDPAIPLAVPVSVESERFLKVIGHGLDRHGWAFLANAPVRGWPSVDIISAMLDTPELSALVPIDIEGMLTDRNPHGLYLKGEAGD